MFKKLSLEEEFTQAKKRHMVSTCANVLEMQIKEELEKEVNIPVFLLKDQIREEVQDRIASAILQGRFAEMYEDMWEVAKDMLN